MVGKFTWENPLNFQSAVLPGELEVDILNEMGKHRTTKFLYGSLSSFFKFFKFGDFAYFVFICSHSGFASHRSAGLCEHNL